MAESEMGGERTEEPSQRRLQEARERGQIPRSRELTNFATMIGGSAALVRHQRRHRAESGRGRGLQQRGAETASAPRRR